MTTEALIRYDRVREGRRSGYKVAEIFPIKTVRDHRVEDLAGVPRPGRGSGQRSREVSRRRRCSRSRRQGRA